MSLSVIQIVLLSVVVVAAVIDFRTRRIYGWLTYPSMVAGIVLNFALGSVNQGLMAIGGCALGWAVMVLPDPKAKMGGGDTALMMVTGAFLGPCGLLLSWGYFALVYGLIAWVEIAKRRLRKKNQKVDESPVPEVHEIGRDQEHQRPMPTKSTLALGPVIALGVVLGIWLEKPTLHMLGILK